MNLSNTAYLILIILCLQACKKDDDQTSPKQCESAIVLDQDKVINGPFSSETNVSDVNLTDDCLSVTFQYGGGCIEDHVIELAWDGSMAESFPPQLWLKIVHDDQDQCEALITKEVSYNLDPIGEKPYIIHLDTWEESILVE